MAETRWVYDGLEWREVPVQEFRTENPLEELSPEALQRIHPSNFIGYTPEEIEALDDPKKAHALEEAINVVEGEGKHFA